jgi:hypothetical protein
MPMETDSKASSICGMPVYTPANRYPNKWPANVAAIFRNYMTVYKPQNPSLLVTRKYIGTPSLDGHSGQDVGAIKVPGTNHRRNIRQNRM